MKQGSLSSSPYYNLQIPHMLFYYQLAVLENTDEEIQKNSLINAQIIQELLLIIQKIDLNYFPILSSKKLETLIKDLESFGNLCKDLQLNQELIDVYQS